MRTNCFQNHKAELWYIIRKFSTIILISGISILKNKIRKTISFVKTLFFQNISFFSRAFFASLNKINFAGLSE